MCDIRNIRKKQGFTLRQISRVTGFSIGHLSDVENRKSKPSPELVKKLAWFYERPELEIWQAVGTIPDYIVSDILAGKADVKKGQVIYLENREVLHA